jgi:putative hydrolase of the HAD superfamily
LVVSASIAAVITAVAFDLDGTLLDHDRAAREAVRDWVAARGWQAPGDAGALWLRLEREHFAAFTIGTITFEEQRRRRLRGFLPLVTDAHVAEEDLDDLFVEYARFYESHWVAFDDTRAVLDDLVAAGYVLGVLTNGQRAQQLAKLTRIGLLDLFAVVVASSELPAGKPDPRAFATLCQQLGTAPGSVVFVGDDPVADVAGARGAGLQAVLLNRAQAGWAPDGVSGIRSLTELPTTLRELSRATGPGGGAGGCPT